MYVSANGFELTKHELAALLAFASTPSANASLAVVDFCVDRKNAWVYATDGNRSVEASTPQDGGHPEGEWQVGREFLHAGLRLLEGKKRLVLHFNGGSLRRASVILDGMEVCEIEAPQDVAVAQVDFLPRPRISLPGHPKPAPATAIFRSHFGALDAVAKASGKETIDIYMPKAADGATIWLASGEATWVAKLLPGVEASDKTEDQKNGDILDENGDLQLKNQDTGAPRRGGRKKKSRKLSVVREETPA